MPGVLIIEAMAQTAGAISIMANGFDTPSIVYFMTIDNAKFRKPVVPGDRLEIVVTKIKRRGNLSKYGCVATVDGAKVAEAEVTAMMSMKMQKKAVPNREHLVHCTYPQNRHRGRGRNNW